jgi:hypothetical protein
MAISASNITSLIFLGQLIKELIDSTYSSNWIKRSSFILVALMILFQSCIQIYSKATHCVWESSVPTLTSKISYGPAKGIYTNDNNYNDYVDIYTDIQYYKSKDKGNILFLTEKPWTYLSAESFPYGTLSTWNPEIPNSIERLEQYYSINPNKKPKYIYILKKSKWNLSNIYSEADSYGYTITENDISYKLEKN